MQQSSLDTENLLHLELLRLKLQFFYMTNRCIINIFCIVLYTCSYNLKKNLLHLSIILVSTNITCETLNSNKGITWRNVLSNNIVAAVTGEDTNRTHHITANTMYVARCIGRQVSSSATHKLEAGDDGGLVMLVWYQTGAYSSALSDILISTCNSPTPPPAVFLYRYTTTGCE